MLTMTELILLLFIVCSALYAAYDHLVTPRLKGETILMVKLRKWSFVDTLIFVGLIFILFVTNLTRGGAESISILLGVFVAILLYFAFIYYPKVWFKKTGFFYKNTFFDYNDVKNMNLSEDGVLVVETQRKRLLLRISKIDDLEEILNVFMKQ